MVMVGESWQNSLGHSLTQIDFIYWDSTHDFFHRGSELRISEPVKGSDTGRTTRLRQITKKDGENPAPYVCIADVAITHSWHPQRAS